MTLRALVLGVMIAAIPLAAHAQADGSKRDAERAIQSYLALWSSEGHFDSAVVNRFYAPTVNFYGKPYTRRQILADKQSYIKRWPVRRYREVPGSLEAKCNADRSLCRVRVLMTWQRISRTKEVSTGEARMLFEFVPVEGTRKIAREGATILH